MKGRRGDDAEQNKKKWGENKIKVSTKEMQEFGQNNGWLMYCTRKTKNVVIQDKYGEKKHIHSRVHSTKPVLTWGRHAADTT